MTPAHADPEDAPDRPLRRGWTTGACATAAAKAAATALYRGSFPDPVTIRLPRGGAASFALAEAQAGAGEAMAAIVKDAGDDPDVTHGCLVRASIRPGPPGTGIAFAAGEGVGTITRPGLQLPPGEPAINPVPRRMIAEALTEVAGTPPDLLVTISIPGGERLAEKTLNGRLGIVGGLSILGTTGIVVPFSCAAWIHSIHRGIDVARASGLTHIAAATGSTSERAVQALYGLPETALIEMGDFVGGTLKYLRAHPVPRLTLAGGFAKLAKLGQGALDLHSGRSRLDAARLAETAGREGASPALRSGLAAANTGLEMLTLARAEGFPLGELVAREAQTVARASLGSNTAIECVVIDRAGQVDGRAPGW